VTDTLVSRFDRIVQAQPAHPAVLSDGQVLSYQELQQRARHIAAAIQAWYRARHGRPVAPTDVIGVRIEKCADLYAAVLGVLATGGSYVPLDPQLPGTGQAFIARRCHCELVLSLDGMPAPLPGGAVIHLAASEEPDGTFEPVGTTLPTDRCYTIFTSGSTGEPKGVAVSHANVLNLVDWAIDTFGVGPATRALQYSTINFDASVLDIFPTLLGGATLCVPSEAQRLSAAGLAELCRRHRIDHAFLPPTLLGALEPDAFDGLRTVLTGGEPCSPQVVAGWSAGRRLYNLYGPTECTVLATCKRMDASTSARNLGRAIAGVRVHVLDEGGQPARRGELHIAGLGVSSGYVGDPAATARRFVRLAHLDASMLYRTGDIVEQDDTGELHFAGRMDRQVKVRGYRIELEEIEGALQRVGCRQAAVTLAGDGVLVAHVSAGEDIGAAAWKARLSGVLADFKIPQQVVQLDELPLKPNGKVDYDRLPALRVVAPTAAPRAADDVPTDTCYRTLAALWAATLSIDAGMLTLHGNFRDLGGTSIHVVRLLAAVERELGVVIPFIEFFKTPTLQFMYQTIQREEPSCCHP
jgi:amino acid adenylation domain-containing protein